MANISKPISDSKLEHANASQSPLQSSWAILPYQSSKTNSPPSNPYREQSRGRVSIQDPPKALIAVNSTYPSLSQFQADSAASPTAFIPATGLSEDCASDTDILRETSFFDQAYFLSTASIIPVAEIEEQCREGIFNDRSTGMSDQLINIGDSSDSQLQHSHIVTEDPSPLQRPIKYHRIQGERNTVQVGDTALKESISREVFPEA